MICDRILRYLPIMLAASANSPWWEGRVTGLHSWRSKVMDGLPTAGLPPLMRNWSEYVWLINHLIDTGYIESIREIWWDVRPHHNFGTVEVRICDVPGSLDDVAALTALVQCVVKTLSDEIDEGAYQHDCHPMLIRQNKWRAARYGLDAEVVESTSYELRPVREVIRDLVARLRPASRELDCEPYLERMLLIADQPTWAQRQIDAFRKSGDRVDVVRQMTEASRLTGKVGAEPA
jgi:carboxylate-amine ligase